MRIVVPEIEEVHVLSNGNTLLISRISLSSKESSVIIDTPYYKDNDTYWFSKTESKDIPLIKSVEIISHEEQVEYTCSGFLQVFEKNIGKMIKLKKRRFFGEQAFIDEYTGQIVEVKNSMLKLEIAGKKNILMSVSDIHSVESVIEGEGIDMSYKNVSTKEKMKVNYEVAKDCVILFTYVERNLRATPSYRMYLNDEKKVANLKLELKIFNSLCDLTPNSFYFHFGNPTFEKNFALSSNKSLFVLNPMNAKNHITFNKHMKKSSVCYKLDGISLKKNSQTVLPVFTYNPKYNRIFSGYLYNSNSSINTSKIVRMKNDSNLMWTTAPLVISSVNSLVVATTTMPFVKINEICEISLKEASSLKIFYTEKIEKISQIKQKEGGSAVVGEVIVQGKVTVRNLKEKDRIVVLRTSFPGTFSNSTVKPLEQKTSVVDGDDLNPKKTSLVFSLSISKKSKKKKFTFKFTNWKKQDQLGGSFGNVQMNSFFGKKKAPPMLKPMIPQQQKMEKMSFLKKKKKNKKRSYNKKKISYNNDLNNDLDMLLDEPMEMLKNEVEEQKYYSSGEDFNDDECQQLII